MVAHRRHRVQHGLARADKLGKRPSYRRLCATSPPTVNGTPMSLYHDIGVGVSNYDNGQCYYMIAPPTGTVTIDFSCGAGAAVIAASISLYNVDQTTPLYGVQAQSVFDTTISQTVTTTVGDLVIDLLCNDTNLTSGNTQDGSQIVIYNITPYQVIISTSYLVASSTLTTMGWTPTCEYGAYMAFGVTGSAGGNPNPNTLPIAWD